MTTRQNCSALSISYGANTVRSAKGVQCSCETWNCRRMKTIIWQMTYVLEQCLVMDVVQLLVQDWLMKSYLVELEAILQLRSLPSFREHSAKIQIEKTNEQRCNERNEINTLFLACYFWIDAGLVGSKESNIYSNQFVGSLALSHLRNLWL